MQTVDNVPLCGRFIAVVACKLVVIASIRSKTQNYATECFGDHIRSTLGSGWLGNLMKGFLAANILKRQQSVG